MQGARLTLAHTGTQALAAELAARFHPPTEGDDKARLDFEDQLNAALLSSELDAKTVDHGPLYAEARHRSGFVPDRSGTVWTLAPMGTAGPADAQNSATTPDVPPDVADKLAALNVLQHALDRAGVALSEARQELYADWCKYLSCAYPDDHGPVLDPDLVRLHIERHSRMHVRQAQDRLENSRKKRDGALAELNRLLAAATPPHEAVAAPADQFWRARDPVLLFSGPAVQGIHTARAPSPVAHIDTGDGVPVVETTSPDAWTPMVLEWEACLHPWMNEAPGPSGVPNLRADSLSTHYRFLNAAPSDLDRGEGAENLRPEPSLIQGRTTLSPHAQSDLIARVLEFLTTRALSDGFFDHDNEGNKLATRRALSGQEEAYLRAHPNELGTYYRAHSSTCPSVSDEEAAFIVRLASDVLDAQGIAQETVLSQAMGGFHDALLQRAQGFQLGVMDPLASPEYRRFADSVRELLGPEALLGFMPEGLFAPLCSGAFGVTRYRLIDAFGRMVEDSEPDLHSAQSLTMSGHSVDGPERGAGLGRSRRLLIPPRLSQPARLDFHFLSGSENTNGTEIFNEHSSTSPLIGWLVPDYLDGTIEAFDATGRAVASLSGTGEKQRPGRSVSAAPKLRNVLNWFENLGAEDFPKLLDALETIEAEVDPDGGFAQGDLALIMGRPMAIVQVRIGLELKGSPARSHGWQSLARELENGPAETGGIEQVQIPVLLGDRRKLSDGLFGFWTGQTVDAKGPIHMPMAKSLVSRVQAYQPDAPGPVAVTAAGGPQTLTLLVDPMGAVHATTGLLPVSRLELPKALVAEALSQIEVSFFTGPVLSPANDRASSETDRGSASSHAKDDTVQVSAPREGGYAWTWQEKHGKRYQQMRVAPPETRAHFGERTTLRDGWLVLKARSDGESE